MDGWVEDAATDRRVAELIVDAMADYLLELTRAGKSPRRMARTRDDLCTGGYLALSYENPGMERALECFRYGSGWVPEYRRKFTETPKVVQRYLRTNRDFGHYLVSSGRLPEIENDE